MPDPSEHAAGDTAPAQPEQSAQPEHAAAPAPLTATPVTDNRQGAGSDSHGNGSALAANPAAQTETSPQDEATTETEVLLCLDIGNTSAHWALFEQDRITGRGDIPTRSLAQGADLLLRAYPRARVGACSVVPAATQALETVMRSHSRSLYLLTANDAPTLTITYPRPNEIGPDRLANAIGAQALYGAPAIVIDMGTATTFDIVSKEQGYIGGIIAPGLAAMTHYLHEKTALLPQLDPNTLEQGAYIGQSTTEAMAVGATRGYPGMIAALLDAARTELAERGEAAPAIILTGGASRGFVRKAFAQYPADPDITLKGLAVALQNKQPQ